MGVKVLLKNPEGKFLLLRRSLKKYPGVHGAWDIVGGRIDVGSTLLENLKREVREETGLELSDSPKLVSAQDILRIPGRHVVRLTYTANIDGEPKITDDHEEFRWFTLEELKDLDDLDIYFKELFDRGMFG